MTKRLLVIDPGYSTGIALLRYPDTTPPELVDAWQFSGGAEELVEWLDKFWFGQDAHRLYAPDGWMPQVVVEKFNARNTGSFSYTTKSLEPLRCEGALVGSGLPITAWVQPPQQYFAGGDGKADKKKRQHAALKALGYYRTGKMLDSPDADDFRSACAHGLAYLSRTGHKPTYDMLSDYNERSGS